MRAAGDLASARGDERAAAGSRAAQPEESDKARTDRQLIELLTELRVVLPGAQVLLGFLLTVPFATRFGRVDHRDRVALLLSLTLTAIGTILLIAPSVYHRLRWEQGGKADVIQVAHRMFLVGTALLAVGILAAMFLVTDVLFGGLAAALITGLIACTIVVSWYALPLGRGKSPEVRAEE
jgi:hypothetical protein